MQHEKELREAYQRGYDQAVKDLTPQPESNKPLRLRDNVFLSPLNTERVIEHFGKLFGMDEKQVRDHTYIYYEVFEEAPELHRWAGSDTEILVNPPIYTLAPNKYGKNLGWLIQTEVPLVRNMEYDYIYKVALNEEGVKHIENGE